jgi:hypothetical protein
VSSSICLEGGGDSKELHIRCREGFRKLLERCHLTGRMPRLYACGGRNAVFDDFKIGHAVMAKTDYVAMMIDSEDPVVNHEEPWHHLKMRDGWSRPAGAADDQVLLMTTCMETWTISDREALSVHFGKELRASSLPPLTEMESRPRHEVQESLRLATRSCPNAYKKGKRSFEILGKLSPDTLQKHLPSFKRARRILKKKLR